MRISGRNRAGQRAGGYSIGRNTQCRNFIMALFNGYNTVAGEDGSTLSGSKKQRASAVRNADQIVGGGPETDRSTRDPRCADGPGRPLPPVCSGPGAGRGLATGMTAPAAPCGTQKRRPPELCRRPPFLMKRLSFFLPPVFFGPAYSLTLLPVGGRTPGTLPGSARCCGGRAARNGWDSDSPQFERSGPRAGRYLPAAAPHAPSAAPEYTE